MPRRLPTIRFVVVALILGIAAVIAWRQGWLEQDYLARRAIAARMRGNSTATVALFLAAWGIATPLGFPALPLLVTGGVLFGAWLGTLFSIAGTILGALGGYFFARLIAPPRLEAWLAARLPLDRLQSDGSFLTLVRMRLVPVMPFSAVNYGAGLAHAPVRSYLASTVVGQLPSTVLYSFFADQLVRRAGAGAGVGSSLLAISGLLLVLSALPWLARRRRSAG